METKRPRHFAANLKGLGQSGKTMDQALAQLRADGATIIECIIAVKEHTGSDLAEAKQTVHASKAWQDVAQTTEKMWGDLIKVIDKDEPNTPPDRTR